MKLTELVPSLDLCKEAAEKIPEEWKRDFADSALVWIFPNGEDVESVLDRDVANFEPEENDKISAPTLAEALSLLPSGSLCGNDAGIMWVTNGKSMGFETIKDFKPSIAALRLWLKVKGLSC